MLFLISGEQIFVYDLTDVNAQLGFENPILVPHLKQSCFT